MNVLSSLVFVAMLTQARPAPPPPPTADQEKKTPPAAQGARPTASTQPAKGAAGDGLALQVALDRAGFSPGVIDGQAGSSTKKALEAYRKQNGGDPPAVEPTTQYEITAEDVAGPFEPKIPSELPDQAKLPALAYKTVAEALGERFHATPELLKKLNRGAKFAAGEQIVVPNVEPMHLPVAKGKPDAKADAAKADAAKADPKADPAKPAPGAKPAEGAKPAPGAKPEPARGTSGSGKPGAAAPAGDVVVTVSKSTSALTVTDAGGKVLMFAPVTSGSSRDPLPIGEWKVNGVSLNPPFNYNPELFWDADPSHSKATIKPGPNNPVGLVWIDLSKEHYGIHGTPEPSTVGKTQSHGCVRLTNWDALKLASLVKPGTKVVFTQ
jgi:lipoprotein-anchoring transpeptidase ErfK/SrfK